MFKRTFKKSFMSVILVFTAVFLFNAATPCISAENTSYQKETINKSAETISEKIELTDKYQEKYFEIIKRNNVLLQCEDVEQADKDLKELENLFIEVENKITNKHYLKKYKKNPKSFQNVAEKVLLI